MRLKQGELFPYRSMAWALYYEDFSDLTVEQIAEVFNTSVKKVYYAIYAVKAKTGKVVEYNRRFSRESLKK